MVTQKETLRAEAIERLRPLLPVGSTVQTKVSHVSRSGMSRVIGCYIVDTNSAGQAYVRDISHDVALATGNRYSDYSEGVVIPGVGMDMTFALVYSLSRALYPDGHRCTGSTGYTPTGKPSKTPRCPSNDHTNDYGDLARRFDASPEGIALNAAEDAAVESGDLDARREARTRYVADRQAWMDTQAPKLWRKSRVHSDGGYALNRGHL